MKYILFILILVTAKNLYSLPCPNGTGIIYKGDSIEEVLKQCGPPLNRQDLQKTVTNLEEWVYYNQHALDIGYSQISFLFLNDRLSNIRISQYNPWPRCRETLVQASGSFITTQIDCGNASYDTFSTYLCGAFIERGATKEWVASLCGAPSFTRSIQTQTVNITEISYGGDQAQGMIFQDGKLIDFR